MKLKLALLLVMGECCTLLAMPSKITFQGTLKQAGVPVNTTKNMQFSFVDNVGTMIPGTAVIAVDNVRVTNGLFAVSLDIDPNIPWAQYTPYVRVAVEGQILSPDQPLNANLYAVAANPPGMVAMFPSGCPVGWTRFTALDNAFAMGSATYGTTGGSATAKTAHGVVFTSGQGSGSFWGFWMNSGHTDASLPDTPVSILPPYVTMIYCQKL